MTVQKTKPGDSLMVPVCSGPKEDGHLIRYDEYVVEKVYPYHVLAYNGQFYQCFSFGELVQMGREDGHNVKREGYGCTGTSWRWHQKG